jgi:hypothetical protein
VLLNPAPSSHKKHKNKQKDIALTIIVGPISWVDTQLALPGIDRNLGQPRGPNIGNRLGRTGDGDIRHWNITSQDPNRHKRERLPLQIQRACRKRHSTRSSSRLAILEDVKEEKAEPSERYRGQNRTPNLYQKLR